MMINLTFPGFGAKGLPRPPGLDKIPGVKKLSNLPNKLTSKVRDKLPFGIGGALDKVDKTFEPLGKKIESISNKPSDTLLG